MLSEADLPAFGDDVDALLFGAISLIPEPCGATYEALMAREHGRNADRNNSARGRLEL